MLTEAAGAHGQVILFVEQLHQFVGANAASAEAASAVRAALERSKLHLIGAAPADLYANDIASDPALNALFQPISLSAEQADADDADERADDNNGFTGEKISTDLRALVESAKSPNDRVGVILQTDDVRNEELHTLLVRNGVTVSERLGQLGAMKVEVPAKAIEELAASGLTRHLSPDRSISMLGHVTATTGADLVRTPPSGSLLSMLLGSTAINGVGVGIAVLDSGIDSGHRSFAGGRITYKRDFTTEGIMDKDPYGHGSHVASAAAGVSTTSGNSYQGVAPGATLINLRVLNSQGVGSTTALLNALNWILSPADPTKPVSSANPLNKDKYSIKVINMSLGAPAIDSYKNDPLCRAARKLVDAGIVVVAAAGNNGKDATGQKLYGQIHAPGNEPSVITVGATNTFGTDGRRDDVIATYSSRGPTRSYSTDANGVKHYDNLVKPDLVAPGNKLIYAESDEGADKPNLLVKLHPELDSGITDDDNKKMMYLSGTSMATPVVAGTAALMLQANPKLTPNMVKAALMYTAQTLAGCNMFEQGAGEVNVEGAVRL
ncbi:MAG TPA: S8 family serine peptidase, partial [Pyrinomonadaceae bacterium]|nr:S8 family serine peptidase [Pyrinomonadaceae bacterium]